MLSSSNHKQGEAKDAQKGIPNCTSERELAPMDDSPISELIFLAHEAGAAKVEDDALRLRERVAEGVFYVASVGQFKRGKSTLLNALIGKSILPVGVPPVTAIVTLIRYGPELQARVRIASGTWERSISVESVAAYVSEQDNPGNIKRVTAIEIFAPNPLLANGMCLVDTPGVGSVIASNTQTTNEFIPHIDAALVVLGIDPPVSAEDFRSHSR